MTISVSEFLVRTTLSFTAARDGIIFIETLDSQFSNYEGVISPLLVGSYKNNWPCGAHSNFLWMLFQWFSGYAFLWTEWLNILDTGKKKIIRGFHISGILGNCIKLRLTKLYLSFYIGLTDRTLIALSESLLCVPTVPCPSLNYFPLFIYKADDLLRCKYDDLRFGCRTSGLIQRRRIGYRPNLWFIYWSCANEGYCSDIERGYIECDNLKGWSLGASLERKRGIQLFEIFEL